MKALKALDYAAIGLGEFDFKLPLIDGLTRTLLNDMNAYPRVLSANLTNRAQNYPHPEKPNESMIGDVAIAGGKNGVPTVGIIAWTGPSVAKALQQANINDTFDRKDAVLKAHLQKLDLAKAELKLLLYQGDHTSALTIPKLMPGAFDVILCLCEEEAPPAAPDVIGKTLVVRVGHRGRHLGIVGAFRTGNADKPFDLQYQLLEVGEEFETPKGQEANNPILRLLDDYAAAVKNQNFLSVYPRGQHPVTLRFPQQKPEFVGSDKCKDCHQAEFGIWQASKHSHAYDSLAKLATKPANRQYDPECVRCHTVGFGYVTGFVDATKTPKLKDVGCENCHGPGSLHVANPKNPQSLATQSPWKTNPKDRLPGVDVVEKGFEAMKPPEQAIFNRVNDVCQKCHDTDNDPGFKFQTFWPKIVHGKNVVPAVPK
jgi:hypothetical protein